MLHDGRLIHSRAVWARRDFNEYIFNIKRSRANRYLSFISYFATSLVSINEHTWAIAGANDKKKKKEILLLLLSHTRARSGTELGPYGVNEQQSAATQGAVPFLINQY